MPKANRVVALEGDTCALYVSGAQRDVSLPPPEVLEERIERIREAGRGHRCATTGYSWAAVALAVLSWSPQGLPQLPRRALAVWRGS